MSCSTSWPFFLILALNLALVIKVATVLLKLPTAIVISNSPQTTICSPCNATQQSKEAPSESCKVRKQSENSHTRSKLQSDSHAVRGYIFVSSMLDIQNKFCGTSDLKLMGTSWCRIQQHVVQLAELVISSMEKNQRASKSTPDLSRTARIKGQDAKQRTIKHHKYERSMPAIQTHLQELRSAKARAQWKTGSPARISNSPDKAFSRA
jgi:uncharacterized Zn finger protein (UPF0148 family)